MLLLEILILFVSGLKWTSGHEHLIEQVTPINWQAIPLQDVDYSLITNNLNATTGRQVGAGDTMSPTNVRFPHRIVGGKRIRITEAPWTVAIIRNGALWCGGSVIRPRWVLTAAHCFDDGGNFVLRAGTRWFRSGGQTRRADKIIKHGQYNKRTNVNDIALIKVNRNFQYTHYVRPVYLPKVNGRLPRSYLVSGWGYMNEDHKAASRWLRRVQLYPVRRAVCAKAYRQTTNRVTRKMLCAEGNSKDTCQGDSGGPLVRNRIQYGVVSFGIGCARNGYPGVYMDVRKYRSYILSVIKQN